MSCYLISNPIFIKHNLYKFGRTKFDEKKIRSTYQRYLFDASVLLYYPTIDYKKDERLLLEIFHKHRLVNSRGYITEWLNIDFKDAKYVLDKYFLDKPNFMKLM